MKTCVRDMTWGESKTVSLKKTDEGISIAIYWNRKRDGYVADMSQTVSGAKEREGYSHSARHSVRTKPWGNIAQRFLRHSWLA